MTGKFTRRMSITLSSLLLSVITGSLATVDTVSADTATADNATADKTEATPIIHDDFLKAKLDGRTAVRGDWKIADGIAHVVQDDELFKKYKNHGPIINYKIDQSNLAAVVEFKPKGCDWVVFTFDADKGHTFRGILRSDKNSKAKSTIQTYTEKQENGKAKPIVLERKLPSLQNEKWHRLTAKVVGSKAFVTLNDQSYEVEHERIDQTKKIAKLSFAFGELSIRKFELDSINESN